MLLAERLSQTMARGTSALQRTRKGALHHTFTKWDVPSWTMTCWPQIQVHLKDFNTFLVNQATEECARQITVLFMDLRTRATRINLIVAILQMAPPYHYI